MENQQKHFIEKIGVKTEKMGYSPLSGRILGALLLAEPPYMTFEDLCDYLSASKSSISTNLNILMKEGINMIEYFTVPGDRKRYFRISFQNWNNHLKNIPDEFQFSNELLSDIVNYRSEKNLNTEFTNNIQKILSFYEFMLERLPSLIEEWEKNNQQ
jgi:DNA-binding transcriptional regulator GbsR (MarR family)